MSGSSERPDEPASPVEGGSGESPMETESENFMGYIENGPIFDFWAFFAKFYVNLLFQKAKKKTILCSKRPARSSHCDASKLRDCVGQLLLLKLQQSLWCSCRLLLQFKGGPGPGLVSRTNERIRLGCQQWEQLLRRVRQRVADVAAAGGWKKPATMGRRRMLGAEGRNCDGVEEGIRG